MEFEKLKEIIEEILHIDREEITESSGFVDDLGADSLDLFQILLCLEETYDIEIEEKDGQRAPTPAAISSRYRTIRPIMPAETNVHSISRSVNGFIKPTSYPTQ